MAEGQVAALEEGGKKKGQRPVINMPQEDLYVEWFSHTLFHAIEPLKVAIDRLSWHHQDDMEVWDSMMILERLVVSAENRLQKFDDHVRKHHGAVGLLLPKAKFPGMDIQEAVGVRFNPKTEEGAGEVSHG